jgi:hypothetical protein
MQKHRSPYRKVRSEFWDLFERQAESINTLVVQNYKFERQCTEHWEKRLLESVELEKKDKRILSLEHKNAKLAEALRQLDQEIKLLKSKKVH